MNYEEFKNELLSTLEDINTGLASGHIKKQQHTDLLQSLRDVVEDTYETQTQKRALMFYIDRNR